MDELVETSGNPASTTVQAVAPVASFSSVSGTNTVSIAPVQGITQVVSGSVPALSQVWYNCTSDGTVGQIVAANPHTLQVDLNSEELTRQFNQLQTPYGSIQVQVQPVSDNVLQAKLPIVHSEVATPDQSKNKNRVRPNPNERVPCPTCGKTVSCNATLRDHMRTHTGERPFVCGECGLAFAQRSNLRMHKRLHTGERPYMCGICGKTFARSSHLPAHMRTHTGEKPYVCEACNHAFITAQQLKNHFRVHTGEKPWKCDLCDAAFTHSSSLSTHKKKHTGRKPYECEKCHKSFFFTSALDKHMKVHSRARPFTCDDCNKSFKYKESLTVHKERYCGKEVLKRTRGPRRPDARKPGPKPGTGRKYVQKRKGRPRGRPRKRKRFSERVKVRRDYKHMEEFGDMDAEIVYDEERMVVKEIKKDIVPEIKSENEDEVEDDEEEEEDEEDEDEGGQEKIPTAEFKVEVISPDEVDPLGNPEASEQELRMQSEDLENDRGGIQETTPLSEEMLQISSSNEISIDENTALTIVSAEEAEQRVAAGGVQLLSLAHGVPLQLVQHEGDDGQITHQIITRDGIQMWCQRQFN